MLLVELLSGGNIELRSCWLNWCEAQAFVNEMKRNKMVWYLSASSKMKEKCVINESKGRSAKTEMSQTQGQRQSYSLALLK